ncbi:polyketide synthase, partial [Eremomyces bilateralis CBS 781.70]
MEVLDTAVEAVRPYVKPITHNLPTFIFDAGTSLIGPHCYKTLLLDFDPFQSPECLKLATSKALGLAIIASSSVVKLPQLIKLAKSRSAEGLSFTAYALETAAFIITCAYNARSGNPFSTYGESALISVQNVAIATMILHFSGKKLEAQAWFAGVGFAVSALLGKGVVGDEAMGYLQAGAGVLSIASKVPQIWTIYKEGGTGQLSAFAVFMYLIGSLSRVFTTLQEVDDPIILYGFIAGFILNGILAVQMVYYWNGSSKTKAKTTTSKKRQAAIKGKEPVPVASSTTTRSKGTPSRRKA